MFICRLFDRPQELDIITDFWKQLYSIKEIEGFCSIYIFDRSLISVFIASFLIELFVK